MDDEPPGDGDKSGFRLPPIKLGRCMVPINGDSDSGCDECIATYYNNFARVSEEGKRYEINDCSRYYTKSSWRNIEGGLRSDIKLMQAGWERLSDYEKWVLEKKKDLLSDYDSAHTRRNLMDMPLGTFLASWQVETLPQ